MAMKALSGHFYALGVGPGDPDLVTHRATSLVESADVVVAPRSDRSATSLALETVRPWLRSGQTVLDRAWPMKRDCAAARAAWDAIASETASLMERGLSVVAVTLGDPSIYATTGWLLESLEPLVAPERLHMEPGISAFQAASSLLVQPLLLQEDRLLLMPATHLDEVEKAMDRCETLVLYKAGGKLRALAELFARRGVRNARAVSYAGIDGRQKIVEDLSLATDNRDEYLTTVVVRLGRREWTAS
jgi:precorrin-2/cobalt-factor-2 C20-methyltransferase